MKIELLTKEQRAELERVAPLYSQQGAGMNTKVHCKIIMGSCCWYVTEGGTLGDAFTLFGLMTRGGDVQKWGFINYEDLENNVIPWGLVAEVATHESMNFGEMVSVAASHGIGRGEYFNGCGFYAMNDGNFTPCTFADLARNNERINAYFHALGMN